jgi:sugar-specific transcriptional regulator TrmB
MDAKVYVFLAKTGLIRALDIAKSTKMNKEQLYRSLKKLQSKGLASATLEHPARFSAVPFEKVLDLFIKAKLEEAQEIQQDKEEILSIWKSMEVMENDTSAKFTIMEGRTVIYSKIQQLIQGTKNRFSTILTTVSLLRANQHGLFDSISVGSAENREFRFLTELPPQNLCAMKEFLKEIEKRKLGFVGKIVDSTLRSFPRIAIRDEEEVIFFISPNAGSATDQDSTCLWTNSKSLVQAFAAIFENLWCNALDAKTRIAELESEIPIPIEKKLESRKDIQRKYFEALQNAQHDIIVLTSAKGLVNLSRNASRIIGPAVNGVAVRIMAPIVDWNLVSAKRLAKRCQLRHIAVDEPETTIIDGKQFFQQKTYSNNLEGIESLMSLKYTEDFDYIDKMKIKLEELWSNASPPLFIQWEIGLGKPKVTPLYSSYYSDHKMALNVSQRQMEKAQKMESLEKLSDSMALKSWRKEASNGYGTIGQAIIQMPNAFKMPTVGLRVVHFDANSAFGEGNNMVVHLWLETPPGHAMVPVAVLADSPKEALINQQLLAGSPAAQNIVVARPHQFEVLKKNNVLFVGWTIEIPLPSLKLTLGSSTLLFQGLGDGRRLVRDYITPGGFKGRMDFISRHAVTTFMNKASFYIGTGIQGSLATECVFTTSPP